MDSEYPIKPLDFDGISTYPLRIAKKQSHVGDVRQSRWMDPKTFSDSFPNFRTFWPAKACARLIRAILYAHSSGKPIIWGFGGHVIKVGLGPVINDLMEAGFVTGIAMNGSAAIHDFEVALRGTTSEEVEEQLGEGRFGMARETGEYMNAAINAAADKRHRNG